MGAAGKAALVTGAAKRVGRAIALELADAGCDLAVHCLGSRVEAAELCDRIGALGRRTCLVQGDLADADTPGRLVAEAVEGLGRLDVLVNNAAVFNRMSLEQFDPDAWQRVLQVNLTAVAALCHHARPHLASTGAGRIVNLCDIAADRHGAGEFIAGFPVRGKQLRFLLPRSAIESKNIGGAGVAAAIIIILRADDETRAADRDAAPEEVRGRPVGRQQLGFLRPGRTRSTPPGSAVTGR